MRHARRIDTGVEVAINNPIPVTYVAGKDKTKATGNYQFRDAFAILEND